MAVKARWLDDVVAAFERLGGQAPLTLTLYNEIETHASRALPKEWRAVVRRTIEEHSSDTETKTKRPNYADVFHSAEGIGKGVWALRRSAKAAFSTLGALAIITDEAAIHAAQSRLEKAFKTGAKRLMCPAVGLARR